MQDCICCTGMTPDWKGLQSSSVAGAAAAVVLSTLQESAAPGYLPAAGNLSTAGDPSPNLHEEP